MKSVRVFYKKKGRMKFVSHLDMNRFMLRIIRKSSIPVWYTEGFNPHPYITFALPLSLGFESEYEIMDFRVTDDSFSLDEIKERLSSVCPEYIEIFKVAEPEKKTGKIAFAKYKIEFDTENSLFINKIEAFAKKESIIISKKTKKGKLKEMDIAPKIKEISFEHNKMFITLPAGGEDNINPTLLLDAFYEQTDNDYVCADITRLSILDGEMNEFK
ncbi:MAG: DUF2344 domain-containing protein [Clostridia bacterium]|nr:DUF2344 domain-containing protein [Clostridia bacterium]